MPAEYKNALESGTDFVFLSVHPERKDPATISAGKNFHNFEILGQKAVTDAATRRKLVAAFQKGVSESDGTVAACFNPRHGISVKQNGKTYDFVICFQCLSASVYVDGVRGEGLLTTGSPAREFNEVIADLGLPPAPGP